MDGRRGRAKFPMRDKLEGEESRKSNNKAGMEWKVTCFFVVTAGHSIDCHVHVLTHSPRSRLREAPRGVTQPIDQTYCHTCNVFCGRPTDSLSS